MMLFYGVNIPLPDRIQSREEERTVPLWKRKTERKERGGEGDSVGEETGMSETVIERQRVDVKETLQAVITAV